ncbi:MAG TPA: sulfotransferase [Solirubrobacteraceae bacterium]|jgi:hypothetical protein
MGVTGVAANPGTVAARHPLVGWTPMHASFSASGPVIRWCFTEGVQFTDPFFDQTIEMCLQDPFRLLFWRETGIEAAAELAAASPGLEPAGFIFHMSRCGSTLLAQMLAGLRSTLVLSEPPPLDTILRARDVIPALPDAVAVDWLRWLVAALGQRRPPEQSRVVIKTDSWAIFQLPLIRRAFPNAACVFLYRDPVEVLVSQIERPGYQMVPGALPPGWFGLTPEEATTVSEIDYRAAVLGGVCEAAVRAAREGELTPIPYTSLPGAVADHVAPLFGLEIGPDERAAFGRAAERDAKNPVFEFSEKPGERRGRASVAVRAAAEARIGPSFESLEQLVGARA